MNDLSHRIRVGEQGLDQIDPKHDNGACVIFVVARDESALVDREGTNGLRKLRFRATQNQALHSSSFESDHIALPQEKEACAESSGSSDTGTPLAQVRGIGIVQILSDTHLQRQAIGILAGGQTADEVSPGAE